MDPSKVPTAPPPPGIVPNFIDPESNSRATIIVSTIMIFLILVFVSGRLFHNFSVVKSVGLDDYACVLAVVLSIAFTGLVMQQAYLFRHQWNVPLSWITADKSKYSFSLSILLGPATFFAKASLLLLYLRVFAASKRSFKIAIYTTLTFCACLYWVNIPIELGLCIPHSEQSWNDLAVLQSCARSLPFAIVQGTLNVIVDFWILWIPLPIIWRLKMKRSKKVWISGIFMTGILSGGCIASILGLVYRVKINYTTDVSWAQNILYLAIICEIDAAITCSSMPAFASLVKLVIRKTKSADRPSQAAGTSKKVPRSYLPEGSSYVELMENSRTEIEGMNDVRHNRPRETEMSTSGITRSVAMEVRYERDKRSST